MKPFSFVHLTDTHIGPTRDYRRYGVPSYPCAERLIEIINAMPEQPAFVIHTGDVTTDGGPDSYRLAADLFARLKAPLYYVPGNHDDPALMRRYLGAPAASDGDPNAPLDYAFEVNGERFVALDLRGPVDPGGHASEAQLRALQAECTPDGPPLTLFIHYPPFAMHSPWLDAHMLIDNGEALHAILRGARDRLRGVFFGHVHRSGQLVRDGITYICANSAFSQFVWYPWTRQPETDHHHPPAYNHVHYLPGYMVVQQYTFPRP